MAKPIGVSVACSSTSLRPFDGEFTGGKLFKQDAGLSCVKPNGATLSTVDRKQRRESCEVAVSAQVKSRQTRRNAISCRQRLQAIH